MMANKRRHLIFDKVYFIDRKTDVEIDSGVCLPWDATKMCQLNFAKHNILDIVENSLKACKQASQYQMWRLWLCLRPLSLVGTFNKEPGLVA